MGEFPRIGHHPVADGEGALDGLDQSVVVLRRLAVLHVQPFEHPEDQERGQPLARRRQVVDGRMPQPDRQGLHHPGAVTFQVLAGDGALDPLQIRGDLASHIAAVEIGQARMGEPVEGIGELEALSLRAGLRQLALDEESLGKAGSGKQGGLLQKRISPLRRSDGIAFAGETDGIAEQEIEGHLTAERPGELQRQAPSAHGPGDGERSIGPARRDGVVVLVPVAPGGGERAGRP